MYTNPFLLSGVTVVPFSVIFPARNSTRLLEEDLPEWPNNPVDMLEMLLSLSALRRSGGRLGTNLSVRTVKYPNMADQERERKRKKKSKKKSKEEEEGKKRRASSEEIVKSVNGEVHDSDEGQQDAKQFDSAENVQTPAAEVWTAEHDLVLLNKVEEFLDQSERYVKVKSKTIYVKDIDWSKITLMGFNAETVQKQWSSITSRIRKMKSAREILLEAKEVVSERGRNNKTKALGAKRKRENPDPAFPKRPKTAFFLFKEKKHAHMIEKYPNLKGIELATKLGKKWQKLSDDKKKYYKDLYKEEKVRFEKEAIDYFLEQFPDEVRPKTAFDLWAERKALDTKEDHPDISERKLMKKLNKKWEKLDSNEKDLWEKLAKKQHDSFRRKMMQRMRLNSN